MKKLNTLLVVMLITLTTFAQNCFFSSQSSPGGIVVFTSTSGLQSPQYYAVWDFGNNTTGYSTPTSTLTNVYNTPGNYTVCMTVMDSISGSPVCTYCDSVSVGGSVTNCNFTYTPDSLTNGLIYFSGPSASQGLNIYWDFGDSSSIAYGQFPTHQYTAPGNYTVCATVFDPITQTTYCTSCTTITVLNSAGCSANMNLQVNNQVLFAQAQVTGGPVTSYLWDFGNGGFATSPNTVYTYGIPGTYNVCLTITTASGCTDTVCQTIVIPPLGACTSNYTAIPDSITPGLFQFINTSTGNFSTVSWNFGDGTITNVANPSHQFNSPGTYNVCLTISNNVLGCSDTYCDTFVVSQVANCYLFWFPDSANTQMIYFSGTPSSAGTTLVWDFGDSSATVTGTNATHTFPGPGTYYVCMTELDSNGTVICQDCQNVTITSSGNCTFAVSQQPGTPFTFTFTANSLVGTQFIWDFGDGTTGTGQGISHTYTTPGTYNVCLSIGIGGAIVCTYCQIVYVAPNSWCQASFSSVSLGLNAYFIDQSTIIPITMPPIPPAVNYSWTFGDGSTSNLQFPNHQYAAPGTYLVCLTASTPGCTSTYCDSIVIDTVVQNPTTCNAYFVFTQTSPYNVVGVNLASGINLSFNWSFGDGSSSTSPYPTHQYNSTGSYVVCLTVSDINGCSSTYCDTLTVDSLGNVVYRGVTSAGFTLNIVAPNLLGIEDSQPAIGSIFPVPATEEINIRFNENVKEEVIYNVMSMDGRRIFNGTLTGTTATLNIASLQQGIYLLEVITSDSQRDSKYFVKQ